MRTENDLRANAVQAFLEFYEALKALQAVEPLPHVGRFPETLVVAMDTALERFKQNWPEDIELV